MHRMLRKMFFAAIFVVLTGLPALAIDPGTARGTLSTDGIDVPLSYAFAVVYGNEEGMLEEPELRLLLTDREVPISVLSGPILDRLDSLARKGAVRGLVLRFDQKRLQKTSINGTVLVAPADPETSLTFFTLGSGEGVDAFDVTETRVTGALKFSISGDTPAETLTVQATFSAPRFYDEVSARLEGADAAASPAAQVLVRWNDALRRLDFAELKRLSSDDKYHEVDTFRLEVGDEAFRKVVATEIAAGEVLRSQIKEVLIRGNRAFIIIEDDEARNVATATREADGWRVD